MKLAYDKMFEPNPWFYELEKEVRKRMAIDYKEEWEKLQREHGSDAILPGTGYATNLGNIMVAQIKRTINRREHLMKEYVKENITTEIDGGEKDFYLVNIVFKGAFRDKISVHKRAFDNWCKNK